MLAAITTLLNSLNSSLRVRAIVNSFSLKTMSKLNSSELFLEQYQQQRFDQGLASNYPFKLEAECFNSIDFFENLEEIYYSNCSSNKAVIKQDKRQPSGKILIVIFSIFLAILLVNFGLQSLSINRAIQDVVNLSIRHFLVSIAR